MIRKNQLMGMTLVEVMVALAIIGIVLIPFLSVFSGSIAQIYDFGNRSKSMYNAQVGLESAVAKLPTALSQTATSMSITIGDKTITVSGYDVTSNGLKAFVPGTLIVSVPVSALVMSESSVSLAVGSTLQLYAYVFPVNATNKEVIWTTSNSAVVTVSNGLINGVSTGTAVITATTVDGSISRICAVQVISAPVANTFYSRPLGTFYLLRNTTTDTDELFIKIKADVLLSFNLSTSKLEWSAADVEAQHYYQHFNGFNASKQPSTDEIITMSNDGLLSGQVNKGNSYWTRTPKSAQHYYVVDSNGITTSAQKDTNAQYWRPYISLDIAFKDKLVIDTGSGSSVNPYTLKIETP